MLKNIFVFVTAACLLCSCKAQQKQLNGIWIPAKINWKAPSFNTLYIYEDTCFIQVASTQAKLKNDSIEFRVEPGFIVYDGFISEPVSTNQFKVNYRVLYRTFKIEDEKLPGAYLSAEISINTPKGKPVLIYEGERYIPADLFTEESKESVRNIATIFKPNKLKEYNSQ